MTPGIVLSSVAGEVKANSGRIVKLNPSGVLCELSETVSVTLNAPAPGAVPAIWQAGLPPNGGPPGTVAKATFRPPGRPLAVQVKGAVPLRMTANKLYDRPATASGSVIVAK